MDHGCQCRHCAWCRMGLWGDGLLQVDTFTAERYSSLMSVPQKADDDHKGLATKEKVHALARSSPQSGNLIYQESASKTATRRAVVPQRGLGLIKFCTHHTVLCGVVQLHRLL
jgi:hypothetical protein